MLASVSRAALRQFAPQGAAGRLSVLIYHRVLAEPDPMLGGDPCAAEFETTMRWVKQVFNVISLSDGVAGLKSGKLPERALCITFDDGYANNESVAAPILSRLGLHATFFLATGFLDGGRMFNDSVIEVVRRSRAERLEFEPLGLGSFAIDTPAHRSQSVARLLESIKYRPLAERSELVERMAELAGVALPDDLMMTSEQASRLASQGFELGGHTIDHPILARLDSSEAVRQIEVGKRRVEELAGRRIGLFAYPNGRPDRDYTESTVALVRAAGFDGAVSTSNGAASSSSDPFQIPRFTPWDGGKIKFVGRMLSNMVRVAPTYASTGTHVA